MRYFLARFKEPSTWAALAALVPMFGVPVGTAQTIASAGAAVAAAVAILVPEQSAQ